MNTLLRQAAYGIIHQAMALHCGQPGEARRYDSDGKMTTFACAGMAGMSGAVVADFEVQWIELGEFFTQGIDHAHAGNTFLNGLTLTLVYTPAAT